MVDLNQCAVTTVDLASQHGTFLQKNVACVGHLDGTRSSSNVNCADWMSKMRYKIASLLWVLSFHAYAADFALGDDIALTAKATVTFGTTIRTESADPAVLGSLSSARVGLPPGQLGGNTGGSDLNFEKGQAVSTVLKGIFELELSRQSFGVFVRAKAWHDFELKDGDRAYGNIPNGFQQQVPLSDKGFDPAAKFSNAQIADAYAFGKFTFSDTDSLAVRAGRQTLRWGVVQMVGGGINAINPVDYPARMRPGALMQEGQVPVGMLYANFTNGKAWGVDGFIQYEFRPTVLLPCGTFFSTSSNSPTGCNYASVLSNVNDATALANGLYPKRGPDVKPGESGQYGLSLRHLVADWDSDIRVYAMNYHNRTPSYRVTNANVAGGYGSLATMTRLTDPNGLKYAVLYVSDIRLYGLSFDTRLNPTLRVFGEFAYRPNQPIILNSTDLVAAFLGRSPASTLNLAKNINAIPPGGSFDGYDRFKISNASIGISSAYAATWGAEKLSAAGELGWSHIAGLPDPGVLHYGRYDDFGAAAINGVACVETTAAKKSCAHDGFYSTNAWGYRLRLTANYPNQFSGVVLTPWLSFAHDISGYSYDGSFLKGRKVLRTGIRAEWDKKYFTEIDYTRIAGGRYNTLIDRDNVVLFGGINF